MVCDFTRAASLVLELLPQRINLLARGVTYEVPNDQKVGSYPCEFDAAHAEKAVEDVDRAVAGLKRLHE